MSCDKASPLMGSGQPRWCAEHGRLVGECQAEAALQPRFLNGFGVGSRRFFALPVRDVARDLCSAELPGTDDAPFVVVRRERASYPPIVYDKPDR